MIKIIEIGSKRYKKHLDNCEKALGIDPEELERDDIISADLARRFRVDPISISLLGNYIRSNRLNRHKQNIKEDYNPIAVIILIIVVLFVIYIIGKASKWW